MKMKLYEQIERKTNVPITGGKTTTQHQEQKLKVKRSSGKKTSQKPITITAGKNKNI